MTRSARPYAAGAAAARTFAGFNVEVPVEGFYRVRLGADTIALGVRIWFGAPINHEAAGDPEAEPVLDRSYRWQAQLDTGEIIDLERVWPACARSPISEADFRMRQGRRRWAQQAAPDSAYAERGRKYDPLSSREPLPF